MQNVRLRRVGGSVMFAVPPNVLEQLQLDAGRELTVGVEDGKIVATASRRKRYTLEELLEGCDPDAPISDEDREWLDLKPVGREII